MKYVRTHRGFTRSELIIAITCVTVLLALLLVTLAQRRRPHAEKANEWHLTMIHSALAVFASDNDGFFPVPGLIDRLPDPVTGYKVTGVGPEDLGRNTTANLYSVMIAMEYFNPDLVISPLERNPVVQEDLDYDWNGFSPDTGVYWDASFVADLETGSNVSFAHVPLSGMMGKRTWYTASAADGAILGNRGPADDVASADSFSCRADGRWIGAMIFADHHVEAHTIDAGDRITWNGLNPTDNPFDFDNLAADADTVITFTKEMTPAGPVIQHD